jgi:hypothetical protein
VAKQLRAEAPVRVNAVSPSLIATPLWAGMAEEKRAAMFASAAQRLPTRRVGQPEDIANVVLFLATALLDHLLHHAVVVQIEGSSYRMREHAALLPIRATAPANSPQVKRRGRPPTKQPTDQQYGAVPEPYPQPI